MPGGGGPGVRQGDDVVVSLRFADGSLAAIAYGSASAVAGKEWIEVHAGSHRVVINDFRSAEADGKTLWKGRQDKGHRACAAAFRQAVAGGAPMPTEAMLAHDARHDPGGGGSGRSGGGLPWLTRLSAVLTGQPTHLTSPLTAPAGP